MFYNLPVHKAGFKNTWLADVGVKRDIQQAHLVVMVAHCHVLHMVLAIIKLNDYCNTSFLCCLGLYSECHPGWRCGHGHISCVSWPVVSFCCEVLFTFGYVVLSVSGTVNSVFETLA